MSDLPWMTVGIDEHARVAAPEGPGSGTRDRRPGGPSLIQDGIDLFGGLDVVGKGDAAPTAAILHAAVGGEVRPAP